MQRACIVLVLLSLTSCGPKPVSYRTQIQPVLNERCLSCHGADVHRGKIVLTSYETLMNSRAVSGKAPLVIPGSPYESRLYIVCSTNQAQFRMPPDTSHVTPLPKEDLELLVKWIMQGAKDN
jgi:hypothetical protein